MQTIKASEFKAKCLHLMDVVKETKEDIVITKNGVPISKLVPYQKSVDSLFGLHKHKIKSHDDMISPIDENWSVE